MAIADEQSLAFFSSPLSHIAPGEKNYDELRTRKVEALSLREFILLKTYEKQASLRKQLVQLEREKEAATTDKLDTQLRLERAVLDAFVCISKLFLKTSYFPAAFTNNFDTRRR